MREKICVKCRTSKPVSEFCKRKRSNDGLNYECRKCASNYPSRQAGIQAAYFKEWYEPKLRIRECEQCGDKYMPLHGMQKRCDACRTKECPHCNRRFIPAYGQHSQVCCSLQCAARNDPERAARIMRCRGKKPRKTLDLRAKRTYTAYDREWAQLVIKRDNHTCRKCKSRGGRLEAHHIKSVAAYPELRFSMGNGKTLCHSCHKKTPNYGSKARHEKKRRRGRQEVLPFTD